MKRTASVVVSAVVIFVLAFASLASAQPKTQLRFAFWGEAAEGVQKNEMYSKIVERLQAKYPNVEVIFEMTPSRDYETKLFTQIAAGSAPDVLVVRDMSTNALVDNGMLMDLDPFIKADGYDLSEFYPQVLDVYRRNGKLYAIPPGFTTLVMLYNSDHYNEAGLAAPVGSWSWDEFADAARKLTRGQSGTGEYDRYGVFINEWDGFWTPFIRQNNGDIFDAEGNVVLDSPQNIETMEFLADLKNNQNVSPPFEVAGAYGWWDGLFMQGKVSMVQLGYWTLGIYTDPSLRWGIAELPYNKRKSTLIYSYGYGISSQTQHPELAWELLKELVSEEAQMVQGDIPSRTALAADLLFRPGRQYPENVHVFIDSLAFGEMAPQTTNFSEMYARINGQVWQILTGEKPASNALIDAAVGVRALIYEGR
jgi:ABC-type sugar transport system, periplasmic component